MEARNACRFGLPFMFCFTRAIIFYPSFFPYLSILFYLDRSETRLVYRMVYFNFSYTGRLRQNRTPAALKKVDRSFISQNLCIRNTWKFDFDAWLNSSDR